MTQYRYRNVNGNMTGWGNVAQDTKYEDLQQTFTTSYTAGVQFQDTTKFSGTNKYDFYISGNYEVVGNGERIINFNVQTYIYDGTSLTNVSNQCTYNGTQTTSYQKFINQIMSTTKKLAFSISCSGLTGNNYYPYMTIQVKADQSISGYNSLYINRFSMIQTTNNLDSSSIINNNNNNTQSIINNNNQNTETIVNNQNENTEKQIESQQVCTTKRIDKNNVKINDKYINQNGEILDSNPADKIGITDFITINENSKIKLTKLGTKGNAWTCIYDNNYTKLQCYSQLNLSVGNTLTIPNKSKYIRFTLIQTTDSPNWEINSCQNGNQAIYDQNNEDNWEQDNPDETKQNSLENSEGLLENYLANDSDINQLTIDVNANDYTTIWEIFNRIITGNTVFYSTFITILTFGIIKTILAR